MRCESGGRAQGGRYGRRADGRFEKPDRLPWAGIGRSVAKAAYVRSGGITPLSPLLSALGVGSHGSVLSENYAPYRLSSDLKSTAFARRVRFLLPLADLPHVGSADSAKAAGPGVLTRLTIFYLL